MLKRRHPSAALCLLVLLAAGAGGQAARAQVLADKVPADALIYAGWAGSDALGPAYDGSHLKAFLEALNLPAFIGQRVSQTLASQTDTQKVEQSKFGLDLLSAVAKSPTAFYVGPFDYSINPAQPVPRIAVFSKVGKAQAGPLATRLNAVITLNRKPTQPDSAAVAAGDFLLFFSGDANLQDRLTGAAATALTLADSEKFKQAFAALGPNAPRAAATLYIDGQATSEMLAAGVQAGTNLQARTLFPALADGLGLNSLQQFAWAGNFDGADWESTTFLGMRDRRPGLLALFDNPPLSQESLKLIPKSATSAGAFRFDGMRMLDDITSTAAKLNDQAPKQIETALTNIYIWSGIDLKRELLPAFGDEFVYYGSPEGAGNSLRGFVLANRLRDAKKAESAVAALENFTNLLITQRDPNSKVQFQAKTLPAPWDKVTAHVMTLEKVTPAWAINDGVFFFALSLPGLQSALEMTAAGKPSILDNPQFVALRQKLGHESFSAFTYADLASSAPETYELVNLLLTSAQARNPNPQAYILPPLNKITPALGPSLWVSWTDAQGYHARETSPFPLAGYLAPTRYIGLLFMGQNQQRSPAAPARDAGLP